MIDRIIVSVRTPSRRHFAMRRRTGHAADEPAAAADAAAAAPSPNARASRRPSSASARGADGATAPTLHPAPRRRRVPPADAPRATPRLARRPVPARDRRAGRRLLGSARDDARERPRGGHRRPRRLHARDGRVRGVRPIGGERARGARATRARGRPRRATVDAPTVRELRAELFERGHRERVHEPDEHRRARRRERGPVDRRRRRRRRRRRAAAGGDASSSSSSFKPRSSVLLNAHFDTTLGSPGAADCAACVGILLEILRLYVVSLDPPPAPIIFLFNGGEETFMQAAHGFVAHHPWAASVGVAINVEATGSEGPDVMFRETGGWPAEVYVSTAPRPVTTPTIRDLVRFASLPVDTDFSVFRDPTEPHGNLPGIDIASMLGGYTYHTVRRRRGPRQARDGAGVRRERVRGDQGVRDENLGNLGRHLRRGRRFRKRIVVVAPHPRRTRDRVRAVRRLRRVRGRVRAEE